MTGHEYDKGLDKCSCGWFADLRKNSNAIHQWQMHLAEKREEVEREEAKARDWSVGDKVGWENAYFPNGTTGRIVALDLNTLEAAISIDFSGLVFWTDFDNLHLV